MVEAAKKSSEAHDKAKAELMAGSDESDNEVFQDCLDEESFAKNFAKDDDKIDAPKDEDGSGE